MQVSGTALYTSIDTIDVLGIGACFLDTQTDARIQVVAIHARYAPQHTRV